MAPKGGGAARPGPLPACGFLVQASKGGTLPISVEKRALGKRVTIVAGVCGNARALCTALTTLLGTGGTVHPRGAQRADVEVQGEQVERVGKALSQLGCLRGLAGEKAGGAVALVAERDCGYDEFLRRTEPRSKARHAKAQGPDAKLPEPPEDAPCRKWHGFWLYCTGACEQVVDDGVWLEALDQAPPAAPRPPARPAAAAQLASALRGLGMLAEAGHAVLQWQRDAGAARGGERPRPAPGPAASGPQRVAAQDGQLVCEECGATFGQRRTLELHRRQHRAERQQEEAQPRHPPAAAAGAAFAPSGGGDSWRYDGAYNSREAALEEESAWGLLGNTAGAAADDDDGVDAVAATYLANRRDAPSLASFIEASLQPAGVQRRRRAPPQAPLAGTEEVACPVCGGLVAAAEMDEHLDLCLATAASASAASASDLWPGPAGGAAVGAEEELPAELLESLLELDLSEEAGRFFWERYEEEAALAQTPAREAFLSALERTLAAFGGAEEQGGGGRGWDDGPGARELAGGSPQADLVTCPVCALQVPADAVEAHVDLCLGGGGGQQPTAAPRGAAEPAAAARDAAAAAAADGGGRRSRWAARGPGPAGAPQEEAPGEGAAGPGGRPAEAAAVGRRAQVAAEAKESQRRAAEAEAEAAAIVGEETAAERIARMKAEARAKRAAGRAARGAE